MPTETLVAEACGELGGEADGRDDDPGVRFHVPLDDAMLRVDEAVRLLGLTGRRRAAFLALVAPEWQAWLDDEAAIYYLRAGTLADRLEAAFDELGLTLDEMALALRTLAPELYGRDAADGSGKATGAAPGTDAKVAAMRARQADGLPLFHPGDAPPAPEAVPRPDAFNGRTAWERLRRHLRGPGKSGQDP